MAPRWIKSKDRKSQYDEDDLLLFSGKLIVGRVYRDWPEPHVSQFSWSLTGFVDPVTPSRGTADSEEAANAELLASWRRWQVWAEVRDAD